MHKILLVKTNESHIILTNAFSQLKAIPSRPDLQGQVKRKWCQMQGPNPQAEIKSVKKQNQISLIPELPNPKNPIIKIIIQGI
jgi:hypothetical protein